MEAHDICDSLAHETEGVRVCVVLDLETGLTLLTSRRAVVDGAEVRRVIQIACLVCQNKLLRQFAATLNPPREAGGLIREAQVSTTDAQIFMACVPNLPNAILVCETDKTMNIGFGWIAVHRAIERLAHVPPESLALPLPAPEAETETEPTGTVPEPADRPTATSPAAPARPTRHDRPAQSQDTAGAVAGSAKPIRAHERTSRSQPPARAVPAATSADVARPKRREAPAAEAKPPATEPKPVPVPTVVAAPRQARIGARAGFGAKPKDGKKG
ncbi:MAG: hypothetical protein OXG82_08225 [Gammaproteobacteria bacterium]|nr:hypothetical protein [Gammaproteobacteria bacterium]